MADALQDYSATETPTPDIGTLQTPLGKVIDQIVVGHNALPELEEVRRVYWNERFSRAEALIQRAKDRGELPGEVDAHFLMEVAVGLILVRANATDQPLDDSLPERIVAFLLASIKSTEGP